MGVGVRQSLSVQSQSVVLLHTHFVLALLLHYIRCHTGYYSKYLPIGLVNNVYLFSKIFI